MTNTNEIRFTGTIERLKSIQTKTGTSMATLLLKVNQDRFKIVAFKNVADAILECSDGDQLSVVGSGSINSWKDKEEHWHNDFQVTAWSVDITGRSIGYQKNGSSTQQLPETEEPPLPQDPIGLDEFNYRGGPF